MVTTSLSDDGFFLCSEGDVGGKECFWVPSQYTPGLILPGCLRGLNPALSAAVGPPFSAVLRSRCWNHFWSQLWSRLRRRELLRQGLLLEASVASIMFSKDFARCEMSWLKVVRGVWDRDRLEGVGLGAAASDASVGLSWKNEKELKQEN